MMRLSETAALVGGILSGTDREYEAVCTDTREDLAGKLFIALRGERFDAHAFIAQAATQRATGALVEQTCPHECPDGFPRFRCRIPAWHSVLWPPSGAGVSIYP